MSIGPCWPRGLTSSGIEPSLAEVPLRTSHRYATLERSDYGTERDVESFVSMRLRLILAAIALAGLTLACGDDDDDEEGTPATPAETATEETASPTSPPSTATETPPSDGVVTCPDLPTAIEPGPDPVDDLLAALSAEIGQELNEEEVETGPARQSNYALLVSDNCGQETLDMSWWVMVCSVPCSEETSASLPVDYFLIQTASGWELYFGY
jgi:hypothetical protein